MKLQLSSLQVAVSCIYFRGFTQASAAVLATVRYQWKCRNSRVVPCGWRPACKRVLHPTPQCGFCSLESYAIHVCNRFTVHMHGFGIHKAYPRLRDPVPRPFCLYPCGILVSL